MEEKVSVIGGGTAGLVTAKRLAKLGINTVVYDQKRVLGEPVRASGILSIKGLQKIGMNYSSAITNTLHGARIHANGKTMNISSKPAVAHVLDRKRLNDICHDEAVAEGADVLLGKRVTGRELEGFSSEGIVVGADGAVSEVARHYKIGSIKNYLLTYKAEYNTSHDDHRVVDVFFDGKVSKGLFGWICPNSEDILEVGIGVDSSFGNAMASFKKFISTKEISDVIGNAKRISEGASMIPVSQRSRIVDPKSRVLLVGDAAGQVKPSTGGGIIYGSIAGILAAESIKNYFEHGADLYQYERAYRKTFMLDIWMHEMVKSFYSGVGNMGMGFTLKILEVLGFGRFLGRYGDMDMPSEMARNLLRLGSKNSEISFG
jgi:geranylgeranyl reductase family protein